jgi:hypothetical protein
MASFSALLRSVLRLFNPAGTVRSMVAAGAFYEFDTLRHCE